MSSEDVGQLHVLTLLRLSLPGIDPNDFRKSMVSPPLFYGEIFIANQSTLYLSVSVFAS